MQTEIIEDAIVLLPNMEHQAFTHGAEIIKKGTIVNGEPKMIDGKRRGKRFVYKLFLTDNDQLIYINKIKHQPMQKTEVTLSADAEQSATVVNVAQAENHLKLEIAGLVIGGILGFIYSRYKKHSLTKSGAFTLGGGAIGYGIGYLIDKGHDKVTFKASK